MSKQSLGKATNDFRSKLLSELASFKKLHKEEYLRKDTTQIFDMILIKSQIEHDRQKMIEEERKKNKCITTYTKRRDGLTNMSETLAQIMQSKYRNVITFSMIDNRSEYIEELKRLK